MRTAADLLREWLAELSPRDTFELGMYRLLAWGDTTPTDGYDRNRLRDWSEILGEIAARLDGAANR